MILSAKEAFASGLSLPAALQKSGIVTGTFARRLTIADKTGSTDEVMSELADCYEEELHTKITGFIASLEPTLVIILSCIVGIILLSIMLPLLSMIAGL